jgi:hypothetical protein
MATFVKCSCEQSEYKGYKHHNSPINIELVTQVEKMREAYYPDNEGTPAIKFHGIEKTWTYSKSQTKKRDEDYERIINTFSKR